MLFKRLADALRAQAPVEFVPPRASERKLIAKARKVPEADKIYFCGLRVWPSINARNGEREWHRSPRNLEKARLLDPRSIGTSKTGTYPYAIPTTPPGP